MPDMIPVSEAEPEWKKQAPILKVRTPAPKKISGPGISKGPENAEQAETPARTEQEPPNAWEEPWQSDYPPAHQSRGWRPTPRPPSTPPFVDPEKVEELTDASFEQLRKAEERVEDAMESAMPLTPNVKEVTQEMAVEAAQAADAAINLAVLAISAGSRACAGKVKEMGMSQVALQTKSNPEFMAIQGKFKHLKRKMEDLRLAISVMRVRNRVGDEKLAKVAQEMFERYDVDKDGFLSRQELIQMAQGEYTFEPSEELVEKTLRALGGEEVGVPLAKFQRLRAMVGIDKCIRSAQERESKMAEVLELASDVDKELQEASAVAERAKARAEGLATQRLVQLRAVVDEVTSTVESAQAVLGKAEGLASKLAASEEESKDAQDEVVESYQQDLNTKFGAVTERVKEIAESTAALIENAKKRFKLASLAEMESTRLQITVAVRGAMQAKSKTGEQLFSLATGKADDLRQEQFMDFVKSLVDLCPWEALPEQLRQDTIDLARVESVFTHVAGSSGVLDKEQFLWLFTRLSYIVLKETALTAKKGEGEEVRKLEQGEVVEVLDLTESKVDGARFVHVRACKDGSEGWARIVEDGSAEATVSMEPASGLFTCVKETILTGALNVLDGETVRRISRGEILEAVDFEQRDDVCGVMRIRCKAVRDGKTGWASIAGNTGITFLDRLY